MPFTLPQRTFQPHPEGRHTGRITEIVDEGEQEDLYHPGQLRHMVSVRIESDTATFDDGQPAIFRYWCKLAGGPRANLTKFREAVLDRTLTQQEQNTFNEQDLIGKAITYRIKHQAKQDGTIRAALLVDSVEPAADGTPRPSPSSRRVVADDAEDDDLPF